MSPNKRKFQYFLICLLIYLCSGSIALSNSNELMNLSVEDLLNIEVTSVAKKAKSLNDSPAAIFVITQDDIKRIGATSIPEALRLAPGIDVARIDSNKWAVSARGFNARLANKLLVLIDGRNTYTLAFAGVYWENQDVMLEDVERIEVIRGPGATLWGANAVNGVINIITKHSSETQGGLLVAGGGTQEQGFGAFRYGGRINSDTTARAYVKGFKRAENTHQSGGEAGDGWDKVQGGFRMDSQLTSRDNMTIQGDAYRSEINQNSSFPLLSEPYVNDINETIDSFGGNVVARYQHTFSSSSDYSMQIFYDFYERDESFAKESRHVVDIDFQHRLALLDWNDLVWGIGYRYNHDNIDLKNINPINSAGPTNRNDQLFTTFLQDEITLIGNKLWLTVGSKFEHNDYSGFEVQPTARIMWALHPQHRLWAGLSRTVRTPSRFEDDFDILQSVSPPQPPFIPAIAIALKGSTRFESEKIISYEVGYRTTFIKDFSIDFTAFYNSYRNLRGSRPSPISFIAPNSPAFITVNISNNFSANTYGFEIATIWQMLDWWRWDIHYSVLQAEFDQKSDSQQRVSIRSAISPGEDIQFDILGRYIHGNTIISSFSNFEIKNYFSMDIRLAWTPIKNLEFSLVGQNLLAKSHHEFNPDAFSQRTEIDRGMYGKLTWHF